MKPHDAVRKFYFTDDPTVLQAAFRWVLAPVVPLYATARYFHQSYRRQTSTSIETPVLSIGNISVGGTGKTAFALRLIEDLQDRGLDVGVLKRGEGRSEGFVPDDSSLRSIAGDYGDEAALYRFRFPEIPIGVGRDRVKLARQFDGAHDLDLLILDDGFQYRQLERDLDVVLVAPRDVQNNWQLPAGPLREPLSTLAVADVVSLKTDPDSIDPEIDRKLTEETDFDGLRLTHTYQFEGIYRNGTDVTEDFRANSGVLISTLARPGDLERFLEAQKITTRHHESYPDHAEISEEAVRSLADPEDVLVTQKEAVKLPRTMRQRVGIVQSTLQISSTEQLHQLIDEQVSEGRTRIS